MASLKVVCLPIDLSLSRKCSDTFGLDLCFLLCACCLLCCSASQAAISLCPLLYPASLICPCYYSFFLRLHFQHLMSSSLISLLWVWPRTPINPCSTNPLLVCPPVAQSSPGVTPESRFLNLPEHTVMSGAGTSTESTEDPPHLCLAVPPNMGTPPQRAVGGLLSWGRPAKAISRSRRLPAREGPGDIPALTWKERLSTVPMITAIAGSCGRGGRLAGRRRGDLSVLTWNRSMDSQRKHGTAGNHQGKREKSTLASLRWSWRQSRRPGVGVADSTLRNTNLALRATRHSGWHVTRSSMMLNLEMTIGGLRQEPTKGQDTGDTPPPLMLWARGRLEAASETQVTKWWERCVYVWGWTFAWPILVSEICLASLEDASLRYPPAACTQEILPRFCPDLAEFLSINVLALLMSWCSMALERMSKKVLLEVVPLVSFCLRKQIFPCHQNQNQLTTHKERPPKSPTNTQLLFSWHILCSGLLAQEGKKK